MSSQEPEIIEEDIDPKLGIITPDIDDIEGLLEESSDCPSTHEAPSTLDSAEIATKKYPGPTEFTQLHVHTLFSTLDGVAEPKQYADRAKHFGMNSVAVTDHGSLGSYPSFYNSCKENGIKFIPGIEAYLNEFHLKLGELRQDPKFKIGQLIKSDPDLASRIRRNRHLILLAKNETGFKNLLHLNKKSWELGYYYKPRIWLDVLRQHKEGLIVLSGCLNGPISFELVKAVECKRNNDMSGAAAYMQNAIKWVRDLKNEFAEDFYFELQMPGPSIKSGYDILQLSISLAKKFNIKTVMTGDSHYLERKDFYTQRALMAIDAKKRIDDPDQFIIDTDEGFFKCRAEFRQTFYEQDYKGYATINDIELACDNTIEVADKCTGWKPNLDPKLPHIDNADEILTRTVLKALIDKGFHLDETKYEVDGVMVTYKQQVKIELDRIKSKGFSSYFLITKDLVEYSSKIGYNVGPGRGSAGGCLVSYLLNIHQMNPMLWGLSFDRFLSNSRGGKMLKVSME